MSDFWRIVLTALFGVGTGILSGMFGIGGAIVSTPAIRVLGATPLAAVASTIPSIIPSAVSGALRYGRERLIDWRIVAWTGGAGMAAAVGGALATDAVPGGGHPLMIATAVLVGFGAYRLGRPAAVPEPEPVVATEGLTDAAPGLANLHARPPRRAEPWRLAVIGVAAGAVSGLLGIGGGVLLVPAFTGWVRLSIKPALATSLACVGVLAVPALITHAALGHIDWLYALPLCVGVVPGARLGAHLTIRSSDRTLRLLVGGVLGVIAVAYGLGETLALV
ncbi:MAG TPA: sulfite exporter TauE/SafE family protein [Acidimicrobiia bacterium]|nr:sulfite exporter TauE/SafE family protein [Acidimicrobiia bacterium]